MNNVFCKALCRNHDCPLNYTDDIHLLARAWVAGDPENLDVVFYDYSEECGEYQPE